MWLCDLEGYWCYWHGGKGYSGVGAARPDRDVSRPARRSSIHRSTSSIASSPCKLPQVTVASIYVPNGGKDFAAKMRFLEAMDAFAADSQADGTAARAVRRHERRAHRHGRAPQGTEARASSASAPTNARSSSASSSRGLVDVQRTLDPDNADLFTWWAPWRNMKQRNIGWRLDYVLASESLAARATSCVVQREFGTSDHGPVIAVFERFGVCR